MLNRLLRGTFVSWIPPVTLTKPYVLAGVVVLVEVVELLVDDVLVALVYIIL